ncbi:WD repeat-containing protein 93-like [Branchiostoma floridae]|uniref:WD repeat-containing protein 93-like n=1 Tax=Branchiostoma floridae TaxID=7739 RepID=A0A9J7HUZ8_BRAFL|nr:WD repeat-containing protein 93-like [Branchiostoma floridae]
MPVFIRKGGLDIPPPSLSSRDSDEEEFLTDPEQLYDPLPQPFRMIDKVLFQLLEDVWDIVSEREEARMQDGSRVRPPLYECPVQMQEHGKTHCMAHSVDGRYIFVGLPTGLAAFDAVSQVTLAVWEETVEVTSLKVSLVGVQMYLLSTVDDMGASRLLLFSNERFYFIKQLNEQEGTITVKSELSTEGDYVGVALENKEKDVWLEVHRLPRDSWLRELEQAQAQALKAAYAASLDQSTYGEAAPETSEGQVTEGEEGRKSGAGTPTSEVPRQTPSVGQGSMLAGPDIKFSPTQMVLRVRPPTELTGSSAKSAYDAYKAVDMGDVIGTGGNHVLLAEHLNQRKTVFNVVHEQQVRHLPQEEEDVSRTPTFHFLLGGQMLPAGLDNLAQAGQVNSLCVRWSGSNNLALYSLLKTGKDIEHKPDLVWPNTCTITASAVSSDTSLVALGLVDGSLTVWDKYLGLQRCVKKLKTQASVTYLSFLNPAVLPNKPPSHPPYDTPTSAAVMAGCSDGALFVVRCGHGEEDMEPVTILDSSSTDTERFTTVQVIPAIPQVVLCVRRNGQMLMYDVLKNHVLCEIGLPSTHYLSSPWEPCCTFGADGQMFYAKGSLLDAGEEYVPGSGSSSMFVYQLRSFPTLDSYWRRQSEPRPFITHVPVNKRCDALLRDRLSRQKDRIARMQERWNDLRAEIDVVQRFRDAGQTRQRVKVAFASRS